MTPPASTNILVFIVKSRQLSEVFLKCVVLAFPNMVKPGHLPVCLFSANDSLIHRRYSARNAELITKCDLDLRELSVEEQNRHCVRFFLTFELFLLVTKEFRDSAVEWHRSQLPQEKVYQDS